MSVVSAPSIPTKSRPARTALTRAARRIGMSLVWIVAALLFLISALPVFLLFTATAVPVYLALALAILDVALVAALFFVERTWQQITAFALIGVALALAAVWLSQHYATTPPIADSRGSPIPGSIATLEKVRLGDSEQWISIRGKDVNNPVLLFLAGGPGGSQLVTARFALAGLEDHFVVVNWEQPGAGKSFNAVDRSTLTPERYVDYGIQLVDYLKNRFGVEKVYVLGESWGSVLGIWMAQQRPDLFHAFIGTGQMVAFTETDQACYDFALQWARERGDTRKVNRLERQGRPPYEGEGIAWKQATYLLDTYAYMNQNPAIADNGFNTFRDLAGPEYGLYDKLNWFRGPLDTLGIVYPHLWEVDLREQAPVLEVPVYFLIGRHDVNAPPVLTEDYYARLDAPHKELIWFEHSGHTPWVSESAAFVDAMVNRVKMQSEAR